MIRLIKLTNKDAEGPKEIWINPDHIICMVPKIFLEEDYIGTHLIISIVGEISVDEDIAEINKLIGKDD